MARRDLARLSAETWDLVVIGGGILGAGIARDAVLRGLRVALVEQSDYSSGTSSRSTKLVHGGFRYLEHWQFRLVAESCRERELQLRLAPHLVWPLSFLLPVYEHDPRPLWKLRAGMTLYDLMAGWRTHPRHQALTPDEAVEAEPTLEPTGLRGAIAFHDCQMDDARLCLENILDAQRRGAECFNYCEVLGMESIHSEITRITVRDQLSGQLHSLRSKVFVNAAGPWVEKVAGLLPQDNGEVSLSPTKGVHLVLQLPLRQGIYFQSRRDDRMIFLLPFGDYTLLGTTDTNFSSDPADAYATRDDVQYLLDRLHDVMPGCDISTSDLITSFAGVRPLLRARGSAPSHRPREHGLVRAGKNLLTIAGGKYTTYRAISEQVVDAVYKVLGRRVPPSPTIHVPFRDQRPPSSGENLCDAPTVTESDIQHACRDEAACRLIDVMRRRTRLALSPHGNESIARKVGTIMARELSWDEDERKANLREYLDEWNRCRPWSAGEA